MLFSAEILRANRAFSAFARAQAASVRAAQGAPDLEALLTSSHLPGPVALDAPLDVKAPAAAGLHCFERLSFQPSLESSLAGRVKDLHTFRNLAHAAIGKEGHRAMGQRCPPRRVVLLQRHSDAPGTREILNADAVAALVAELTGKRVERISLSDTTPPLDQMRLFSLTGLLLSPHGGQLSNLVFSHANSAIVEIAPEELLTTTTAVNYARLAKSAGGFLQQALGGESQGSSSREQWSETEHRAKTAPAARRVASLLRQLSHFLSFSRFFCACLFVFFCFFSQPFVR